MLAAALSAMMSTASGTLIASATVANNDIWARLRALGGGATPQATGDDHDEISSNRVAIAVLGVLSMAIACVMNDVIAALTFSYNLLVGGLLVPILGALVWRRGNQQGALAAMASGGATVLATMAVKGLLANEPIYYGLAAGLVTRPTEPAVLEQWDRRLAGDVAEPAGAPTPTAEVRPAAV